jgi:cyclopropane-fatty-acyl-phospholipid synthase
MKQVVQRNFDASVSAYDAYERRTRRFSTLTRLLAAEMAAHASSFDHVLDAGAGSGVSTSVLHERASRVVALDISREMLRENAGADRVQGDFDSLPFADDTFDGVAYAASLFLAPDPSVAVEEARRVLRSGGVVGAVAPLGWFDDDGTNVFDALPRESRSPTPTSEVQQALETAFDTTSGTWSFPTTAADVQQFHMIPAMAARLYPRSEPEERLRKTRDLLDALEGTFEQRWQWLVGTTV